MRLQMSGGILLISLLLSGCNHLFYQPHKEIYLTPAKVKLTYEPLTIDTVDGERLQAWLIPSQVAPAGDADSKSKSLAIKSAAKPKATILHFHGNGENMSTHFLFVGWLALHGYDVMTFDYRGYGESSGEATRAGLLLDAEAAIKAAAARSDKLVIIAQSLGGAVALPAIARLNPASLKLLVLDSTFASYRDVARQVLNRVWLTWPFQYPLSWLISDELSPLEFAGAIKTPVLMLHSPQDPVVPFRGSEDLYERLGSQKKDFWKVDGKQHTEALSESPKAMRDQVLKYIDAAVLDIKD